MAEIINEILAYPVPRDVQRLLTTMLEVAEQDQVITIWVNDSGSPETSSVFNYEIQGAQTIRRVDGLIGRPIEGLQALGFLESVGNKQVILTAKAYTWIKYQRGNRLGKWWMRNLEHARDVILAVVTTITVALTVLQIMQLMRLIP